MSNDLGPMAPMPVHNNTDDPLWRTLWDAYEPLITALRRIPLVTNIESGNAFGITAELADGSYLWIASYADLPVDPEELEGFFVRRLHADNPTVGEIVYDSTDDGEQSEHRNNFVPLIRAVTTFVTERKLAPRVIDLVSVQLQGVTAAHKTVGSLVQGPFEVRQAAVKDYGYAVHDLAQKGWRCIHEQGGTEWPLTVWEQDGAIVTVYVAHVGQTVA